MNTPLILRESIVALRHKTLVNIKDCKAALVETQGDLERAEELLRDQGRLKGRVRANRQTDNGRVFSSVDSHGLVAFVLGCETEFVAMNRVFLQTGEELLKILASKNGEDVQEATDQCLLDAMAVIKENITIRNLHRIPLGPGDFLGSYDHDQGRIFSVVVFHGEQAAEQQTLAQDLAMHVCAAQPEVLHREDLTDQDWAPVLRRFRREALEVAGKDSDLVRRIIIGKTEGHIQEICLMDQAFVRDPKRSVRQVLQQAREQTGPLDITSFLRLSL